LQDAGCQPNQSPPTETVLLLLIYSGNLLRRKLFLHTHKTYTLVAALFRLFVRQAHTQLCRCLSFSNSADSFVRRITSQPRRRNAPLPVVAPLPAD
jgi:hypothetical protein